jgi:hypothetical protein
MNVLQEHQPLLSQIAEMLVNAGVADKHDDFWHGYTLPDGQEIDINVFTDDDLCLTTVTAYMVDDEGNIDTTQFLRVFEQAYIKKGEQ